MFEKLTNLIKNTENDNIKEIFKNIVKYIEENINNLKEEVKKEKTEEQKNIDIYSFSEKLIDNNYVKAINTDNHSFIVNNSLKGYLDKKDNSICFYFFELSDDEIEKIIKKNEIIKVKLTSKGKTVEIDCKFERNYEFIDEDKKLYEMFKLNLTRWKTIFNPFSRKILNLKVINFEKIEDFENAEVNINLNNSKAKLFHTPENNLISDEKELIYKQKRGYNSEVIYDYKLEDKNIILVDTYNFKIINIKEENDITVITADKHLSTEQQKVKYYKKTDDVKKEISNKIRDNFLSLYKNKFLPVIKTKFEIENVVNSFEISQNYGVKFEGFELIEYKNEKENNKLINYNWFLEDEYIIKSYSKTLLLKFSVTKKDYLTQNVINFLTSEIQLYFREYFCKGEIIE